MDYLSWVLAFVVIGYAAALTVKTGKPLYRYRKVKDKVEKVDGFIAAFYGVEETKRKGETVSSYYPVFRCEINGKTRLLDGLVRYIGKAGEANGQKVVLLYDKETDELWCERDLPQMEKLIKIRLLLVAVLLVLLVVTSVKF